MKTIHRAKLTCLAFAAALAVACVEAPFEDEEVVDLRSALSIEYLFDDPSACSIPFSYLRLQWYSPHSCGVISPGGWCAALSDQQCMAANPRLRAFLQSTCWYSCQPVDPPPPPTCADCANPRPPGSPPWAWAWCGCCQNGQIQQPCIVPYGPADRNPPYDS